MSESSTVNWGRWHTPSRRSRHALVGRNGYVVWDRCPVGRVCCLFHSSFLVWWRCVQISLMLDMSVWSLFFHRCRWRCYWFIVVFNTQDWYTSLFCLLQRLLSVEKVNITLLRVYGWWWVSMSVKILVVILIFLSVDDLWEFFIFLIRWRFLANNLLFSFFWCLLWVLVHLNV